MVDPVALENPISESQLLNLDMNIEVLNVCESARYSGDQMEDDYSHKEVVLDSDDEGGDRNEPVDLVNVHFPRIRRLSGRDEIGLRKKQKVRAGCFRRLDKKVRKHVFLLGDEEINSGRTCRYSDSRFHEHLGVMDCVLSTSSPNQNMVTKCLVEDSLDEFFLSSHDSKSTNTGKDASYDCELEQLSYDKSPEESHNKALSFVDHYLSVSDFGSYKNIETGKTNRITSPPALRSKGSQCLARRVNLARNASTLTTFNWTEKHIDKDVNSTLGMNEDSIFGFEDDKSAHLSSSIQESDNFYLQNENSNDVGKIGSNSGTFTAYNNNSTESDKPFDGGSSRPNTKEGDYSRLTPEALDIGLDTQIAAEAMEDLMRAAPAMFDPRLTHQDSDDTLFDSSYTAKTNTTQNNVVRLDEAIVGWRRKQKRSRCMKISTVQDKNLHCFAANQLPINKKPMAAKVLRSRSPENSRNTMCRGPTGISLQQEEYGLTERDSLKDFKNTRCVYVGSSKEIFDGLKSDPIPKRRIITISDDDVCKIGVKDTSFKVKTDTSNMEEILLSNLRIYPKGRRSRTCTLRFSVKNQSTLCAAIANNLEKLPILNDEKQKGVSNLLVYRRRRKASSESEHVPNLLVYRRRQKVSSESEHTESSLKLTADLSPSVNLNAAFEKQIQNSVEFSTGNLLNRCCESVDGSNDMKLDVLLSNGRSSTLRVLSNDMKSDEKIKHPFDHLPRSPALIKELTRLGYTESLPDFLPKDSRRRRAMEKVCILFSQNLETNILKQQRKIVARLGFSITNCCSEATHFVTDRFARTMNMLEAMALGKHVVTHFWLESCERAGCVIDEKSYILRDEKKEKEIGFNMLASISRASRHPILKGRRVLVTPNAKPNVDAISNLVVAVGGLVIPSFENGKTNDVMILDDLLIISCEEDYRFCLPFLEKGALIYNSELLLNGIVTQKLEYERYQLFEDHSCNGP